MSIERNFSQHRFSSFSLHSIFEGIMKMIFCYDKNSEWKMIFYTFTWNRSYASLKYIKKFS